MTTPDRYRKIYRPQNAQEVAQMEETERWFNRLIAANASLQGELAGQVTELNGRLEEIAASIPTAEEPAIPEEWAEVLAHLRDFDNPHQTSPANLEDCVFSGTETAEVIGAGDGATLNFSGTLSVLPIVPSTVIVSWTIGGAVQTLAASSSGTVSMTPYVSGLFRTDGTWYLNFGAGYAPDNATNITVTYSYVTDQQFLIYDAATGLYTWRTAMAADIYCAVFDGVLTGATTVQAALDIVDEFDTRYLKLDCSNDPLTASLDIDGNLTLTADATTENRVLTVQGYDDVDGAVRSFSVRIGVNGFSNIVSDKYIYIYTGVGVEVRTPGVVYLGASGLIDITSGTSTVNLSGSYVSINGCPFLLKTSSYLMWADDLATMSLKLDYDGTDFTLEKYDTDHWDPYALTVGYGGTGACLAAGALGDLLVADAASTFARLSGNTSTTPKYLKQTGDGAGAVVTTEWAEVDLSDYVTTTGLTAGTVPKASDTHALADSLITESGAVVSVEGDLTLNADALGENRTLTIEGYDTGASAVDSLTISVGSDGRPRMFWAGERFLHLTDGISTADWATNIFIGYKAGSLTANHAYNIGIGVQALEVTAGAERNTAIGFQAGKKITSGGFNCLYGYSAGSSLVGGKYNSVFGCGAMPNNEGGANSLFGTNAGAAATSASNLAGFGYGSLSAVTTAASVSAFGASCLISVTQGSCNSGFGTSCLGYLRTGLRNSGFGYECLLNATGSDNSAFGNTAMRTLTSGNNNTAYGAYAGYSASDVSNCVFFGYKAGYYETASNKLFIDNAQRASEADARVKALIYGIFAATTAGQSLYFNANVYVSDALDVNGAAQFDGTINVGVDDTGHDVQFFGATSGKKMHWDESEDSLKTPGRCLGVVTKTSDYTLTTADDVVIANKATAITITMPAATGSGRRFIVKSIGAGACTIDGDGADTIDGAATAVLSQYDAAQLIDYAANAWVIV